MLHVELAKAGPGKLRAACGPRDHFMRAAGTYRNINFTVNQAEEHNFRSLLILSGKLDMCGRDDFFCSSFDF